MSNSLGKLFKITTFGESHGPAIGVVIDGCPPNLNIDKDFIQNELSRRKPGQSKITTQRKEDDEFDIVSGVFEGKSTGTPICILIPNKNVRSKDYSHISEKYRPSHADFTYNTKYGIRDYRGGGRSSARETANWVASGAIAKLLLKKSGVQFNAYVSEVGNIRVEKSYKELDLNLTESNIVRCPDQEIAEKMIDYISEVKKNGDTVGGVITGVITGLPTGLGEPIFNKFHASLSQAMMSINAVKAFEYGSGFAGSMMLGSQHNDPFYNQKGEVKTKSNHSGGVQGGITNSDDVYFRVGFKPVATIMKDQESVDAQGNAATVTGKGRHDPCVVPRAVPIVEAMAALVTADFLLLNKTYK